jgi:hypothetical protein
MRHGYALAITTLFSNAATRDKATETRVVYFDNTQLKRRKGKRRRARNKPPML